MKIGIIGCGYSGTSLLWSLSKGNPSGQDVFVFNKEDSFGEGLPYTKSHAPFFMNVPSPNLSISPDDPGHFEHWLRKNDCYSDFVSRSNFGSYLRDCFETAAKKFRSITKIPSEVISVKSEKTGFTIETKFSGSVTVDLVVVATGPAITEIPSPGMLTSGTWFSKPWDFLSSEKTFEKVLVLGSGLTACDVASYCLAKGTKQVALISRHGLLPQPHNLTPKSSLPMFPVELFVKSRTLSKKLHLVREFCTKSNLPWQHTFDQIRPHTSLCWQSLSVNERRRFLSRLRTLWDVHRHRMPPQTEKIIRNGISTGQIQIIKGSFSSLRQNQQVSSFSAEAIVVATGMSFDPHQQPLLKSLENEGLIERDHLGLGFTSMHPRLFTIGGSRIGQHWESTAVKELSTQALELAKAISSS